MLENAESAIRFVELNWKEGRDVHARYADQIAAVIPEPLHPTGDLATFSIHSQRNPAPNPLRSYLNEFGEFTKADKLEGRVLTSWIIPSYYIPAFKNPFVVDIGDLQSARDALKYASRFEDIRPSQNCLSSPKP